MKILMVCLGNICRSPLAEGIMKYKLEAKNLDWEVDSAGTAGYHQGELPDVRSIAVAKKNGIDITNQRSRKLVKNDLNHYDHILAMDASNYNNILSLCEKKEHEDKVALLLNYAYPGQNRQVPDPYYEGGFDAVFDMIEKACDNFIQLYT